MGGLTGPCSSSLGRNLRRLLRAVFRTLSTRPQLRAPSCSFLGLSLARRPSLSNLLKRTDRTHSGGRHFATYELTSQVQRRRDWRIGFRIRSYVPTLPEL